MDLHAERSPGLALPTPAPEQGGNAQPKPAGPVSPEFMPSPLSAPPMPGALPASQSPAPSAMPIPDPVTDQPVGPNPAAAASAVSDDASDVLDQEWISKAKAIVEQTKNDPFVESRELSKAKADYLRIRYNKHIKVAGE